MAKVINYTFNGMEVKIGWNEINEEIAKAEADNGKYTIEDDGIDVLPTTTERLEALESAMLEMIMEE